MAMPGALRTSRVVWVLAIDEPTTKRENASSMIAPKRPASQVERGDLRDPGALRQPSGWEPLIPSSRMIDSTA